MTIPTLVQQLEQINEAITAIEVGGQEYQIGPRRLKRADLSLLYTRRKELEQQIINANDNGGLINTSVAIFDWR